MINQAATSTYKRDMGQALEVEPRHRVTPSHACEPVQPMSGTPLPREHPQRISATASDATDLSVRTAYNVVLQLEALIQTQVNSTLPMKRSQEVERQLMYCRIIGHFFHCVPSGRGMSTLVHDVNKAQGDKQKLLDLGKFYYDHALRVFRSAKGQTPAVSTHPSLDNSELGKPPLSHKDAKTKALIRDGYRCVVTGKYDYISAKKSTTMMLEAKGRATATECAHIFSESTNASTNEGSKNADYTTSAWGVLSLFGSRNLLNELNGPGIHRLENVMTLDRTIHLAFDSLDLWFKPTDIENQYKITTSHPGLIDGCPNLVQFTTSNPLLPLPSRDYLALHAACAEVAHLSGAAEHLDSLLSDMEDTKVLAKDGSSALILEHAIWTARPKLLLSRRNDGETC